MKRKIILSFLVIVISLTIKAQNEEKQPLYENDPQQYQTVFNQAGPLGWWIAPEFSYTMINKKNALLCGLSGGVIINHNFSIGLQGIGLMTNKNLKFGGIIDTSEVYLYGGYGGLLLEYRFNPLRPINIAFPLLIGGGGAAYSTWGPDTWNNSNTSPDDIYNWDSYFVIEPGVMIGINLFKFMRLDGGVTYRLVHELNLPETDTGLLNGWNAKISLKLGRF